MQKKRSTAFNVDYWLSVISRRRWFLILPFCLAMLAGIYLAITLPKEYEASTLILIRPPNVPERYVKSIVTSDIETRISTISQQILSRTNLERIIDQFGLYGGSGDTRQLMEDKIDNLRSRIRVEVSRTRRNRDADAFTITYRGKDPYKVMQVANGLATAFIDENLKVREALAVGTSSFLDAELENTRKRLAEVEEQLKEYRGKYMGELPEQLDSNLRILDRLQAQLSEKELSLRQAQVSLAAVNSEIEKQSREAAAAGGTAADVHPDDRFNLPKMKEKLAALQSAYTERHPDVVRLKNQIAKLEAELANAPYSGGDSTSQPLADPALLRKQSKIAEVIQSIQLEIGRLNSQIAEYRRRVEATPKREQELRSLRRDYENMQNLYNSLLNRKLEAEIAVNMEKKQKGEQFRIIDTARLPERPISPDMRRLFLLTLAAGLGAGFGLIYLLEAMDTSLKRPDDFEADLGLAVLATVPRILQRGDKIRIWTHQALTTVSVVTALLLLTGMALLVFNGVEPTIDLLRHYTRI